MSVVVVKYLNQCSFEKQSHEIKNTPSEMILSSDTIYFHVTKQYETVLSSIVRYSSNKIRKTQNEHLIIICCEFKVNFLFWGVYTSWFWIYKLLELHS
jgi:hypothetical protein